MAGKSRGPKGAEKAVSKARAIADTPDGTNNGPRKGLPFLVLNDNAANPKPQFLSKST